MSVQPKSRRAWDGRVSRAEIDVPGTVIESDSKARDQVTTTRTAAAFAKFSN
jgi:hypothetical protein